MKKEDKVLIHVKLNHDEVVRHRRDMLMLELEVLRILKTIDNYKKLRISELDKKLELKKNFKEANNSIRTLKTKVLPKIELLKNKEKEEHKKAEVKRKAPTKKTVKKKLEQSEKVDKKQTSDLDSELKKIEEELKKLQ